MVYRWAFHIILPFDRLLAVLSLCAQFGSGFRLFTSVACRVKRLSEVKAELLQIARRAMVDCLTFDQLCTTAASRHGFASPFRFVDWIPPGRTPHGPACPGTKSQDAPLI